MLKNSVFSATIFSHILQTPTNQQVIRHIIPLILPLNMVEQVGFCKKIQTKKES